ncbi:MAG: hypothetical protein OEX77_12235 [Candidatus Bathyarchaeota archaeon]|nr:hypothetical protein [Candidatus Bathyarchaeota archaeon]
MTFPECGSESLVSFSGMDVVFYRWICLKRGKVYQREAFERSHHALEKGGNRK